MNVKTIFDIKWYLIKGIAITAATILYVFQWRFGHAIIIFLIVDFILSQSVAEKNNLVVLTIIGLALFYAGHVVALKIALMAVVPLGIKAYTFWGGCYGGIIEFGCYLLIVFIPLKWISLRSIKQVIITSWAPIVFWLLIAALVQGTYMAGYHDVYI